MFSISTRRGRIRLVSYLTALILLLGLAALRSEGENLQLRRAVSNSYARAFSQLTTSLDKMDTALQKGRYVTTSSMLCSLCGEVYAQSQTGQMALAQLPLAHIQLEQTASFLSTVGDYALALSRSAGHQGIYQEQEQTNWLELSQAARTLSGQLEELELRLLEGNFSIGDLESAEARLDQVSQGEALPADGFSLVEAEFPQLPSLIYDGPFSQHLSGKAPAMLEGEPELSREQAERRLAGLLEGKAFSFEGTVEGDLPCYVFSCQAALGRCTVYLTRQGGHLLCFVTEGTPSERRLSLEEGMEAADELLERMGYEDMEESYYQIRRNILTVNYHSEEEDQPEDVRCYTDLVKVSVSLADGAPLAFEGHGYLANHRDRSLPQPRISRVQAEQAVSSRLEVLESRLALIPSRGEEEVLCWEFVCRNEEGERVISYISAADGSEQRLLLLLEDESGTLVL